MKTDPNEGTWPELPPVDAVPEEGVVDPSENAAKEKNVAAAADAVHDDDVVALTAAPEKSEAAVETTKAELQPEPKTDVAAEPKPEQPSRFAFLNVTVLSYGLALLGVLGLLAGLLPAWVAGAGLLPLSAAIFGWKRGLTIALLVGTVMLPAFQPVAALVTAPLTATVCGVVCWRRSKSRILKVLAFIGGFVAYCLALVLTTQLIIPQLQPLAYEAYSFLPCLLLPLMMLSVSLFLSWKLLPRLSGSLLRSGFIVVLLLSHWALSVASCWLNLSPTGIELQMRWSMKTTTLSDLPLTENDRILPRATGEYFVKSSNTSTGFSTESPHIVLEEGNLWWQSPLHNDRWYGRILGSVPAIVRIDADKTDKQKEDSGSSGFIFGNESWVLKAAFKARHFLSEPGEATYYHRADKSWVMLVPCISKRLYWTGVMLPTVTAVMAVEQDGFIHDYSVRDAQKLFPGAVFYPPDMAIKYAHAYAKWRGGFWKTVVAQSGMMEVSENESNDAGFNPQPYIINFKGLGLQEVVAFEPFGEHQYAMVEVLMFDAASGKLRSYVVPDSDSMSGPRRCMDQVRSSDSQTDWSHRRTVEPRLTVSEKGIFFLVTITAKEPGNPYDQPYITSVLINARTLHSQRFQQAEALRKYLAEPRDK